MAITGHCGNKCAECNKYCSLDQLIPCSPDCENLTEDGRIKVKECLAAGCDEIRYILDKVGKTDEEILELCGEVAAYPYEV